jgi:hypothetical protein
MDQKSFEEGLIIGLNTALAVLRDGGGIPGVTKQRDDLKEMIATRRNRGVEAVSTMVAGDIFCAVPLAHPGDLGFAASPVDEMRVALSTMKAPADRGCLYYIVEGE